MRQKTDYNVNNSHQIVEDKIGVPVVSAATCTTFRMLEALKLEPFVPGAGRLLSGQIH
ncbi:hypothetical protein [Pseudorhodoplanes sinuspersici]|uniref:hypothetical protein n=1 Tax=Pseudorhodoplanes sinuspersici TaxID=1235591 RepID=UPI0018DF0965|nr:hypothetical protein [Pseudorhodoplanes sinuspersici]